MHMNETPTETIEMIIGEACPPDGVGETARRLGLVSKRSVSV